jgi:predicted nucleotidyltransferase
VTGTQLEALVGLLADGGVEFVVVGGLAAVVHGSAYVTHDVDVCYGRSATNVNRLCGALAPAHPTLRGAPPGLPFRLDPPTVAAGLNFTLDTDLGALDILGEVQGLGAYPRVVAHSEVVRLFGRSVQVLTLEALILAKRAAGRRKDLLLLPELEALLDLKKPPGD